MSKALTRRRTTGETTVRAQRGHKVPKLVRGSARLVVASWEATTKSRCRKAARRESVGEALSNRCL